MAEKDVISWCLVVLGLILVSPANGMQCREAVMAIWPCEPFLLGYGIVTFPCCFAAAALNQIAASSQPHRKDICECLVRVGKAMEVQLDNAKQLPQLCQINATIPIDEKVDCNKY
ncbi:non-specific lipid-transfer protein 1 [Coffea arabica]|uniref:Non-specific lipid-transfer protein 1 n=1 Tax=Coffea arabica TaxID=13443 RepID=A0A6P6UDP8_COFAR